MRVRRPLKELGQSSADCSNFDDIDIQAIVINLSISKKLCTFKNSFHY